MSLVPLYLDTATGQIQTGAVPSAAVPLLITGTYEVAAETGVVFPATPVVASGGVLQLDSGAVARVL